MVAKNISQLSALVFQPNRGHAHPRVVGQQGHDPLDIAVFEGSDKARQEFLFGGRVSCRRLLVGCRHLSGQGGPSAF